MIELDGEPIAIRPMQRGDMPYVIQTWMRTYKALAKVSDTIYELEQPRLIQRIMLDGDTRFAVACSPDVESTIHGWACGNEDYLHYAYIPVKLRGKGLARILIESVLGIYPSRIEVTHHIPSTLHSGRYRFVYNPYHLGVPREGT